MKTVIFDFDGTIVDSVPLIYNVVNKVLKKYKYPEITEAEAQKLRSKNTLQIIKESKIPFWKMPFMVSFAYKIYGEEIEKVMPYKGMKNVITNLKANDIRIGIVSSNTNKSIQKVLIDNDFPDIDFLYTSKNLGGKSHMIKNCMKKFKLNEKNTVYIGDEIRDIEASNKNGIRCIAVTWGFNTKESLNIAKPYLIVENITGLNDAINNALND